MLVVGIYFNVNLKSNFKKFIGIYTYTHTEGGRKRERENENQTHMKFLIRKLFKTRKA